MDREPKDAPFPVGTKLRYKGTRESYSIKYVNGKEERQPIMHPGIEVVISRIFEGHRGTLEQLSDCDGPMYDDSGEPVIDTTEDACSCYDSAGGGRLIRWDGDIADWEVVSAPARFCQHPKRDKVCGIKRPCPDHERHEPNAPQPTPPR